VLISDDYKGDVLLVRTSGINNDGCSACAGAWVEVAAGESWSAFVDHAIANHWLGIESLAGIPGTVGATPIQNVGAYGQQVSDTIAQVRVWNRETKQIEILPVANCEFSYRSSIFKQFPLRYVILSVTFQLPLGFLAAPISYPELAKKLNLEVGQRAPSIDVREAVLELRKSKGMVLNDLDHDTWSAGSFFTNPIVDELPEGAPDFVQPDGRHKTSAAWLIENAGLSKGFALNPRASISTKHTLALTNRGNASSADLIELAKQVQDAVAAKYQISLTPEVRFVE
jgi:UDP-N-acetylmuramate dehydrogenase